MPKDALTPQARHHFTRSDQFVVALIHLTLDEQPSQAEETTAPGRLEEA